MNRPSPSVQELLLAVMAYDERGSALVASVPVNLYEAHYREIAAKLYSYWGAYHKPPGEHFLEVIDELISERKDSKDIYELVFESIVSSKDNINAEYVLGKASQFVRQQRIKAAFAKSVPLIESGELDKVADVMTEALRSPMAAFHPGLEIADTQSIFELLRQKSETFPTGIRALDSRGLGPARKELMLIIGSAKSGKSWFFVHLAKHSLLAGLRVLHVTLEMSEARMAQRYFQALFSVSKRQEEFTRAKFQCDEWGTFIGLKEVVVPLRPSFEDDTIESKLTREIKKWRGRLRLWIKQFPTGSLTIAGLRSYLDQLEVVQKFIPDLLIVDYTDLMEIDPRFRRECVGKLTQDLRGIGVERNIAVAAASQGTRAGAKARTLTETHVAEDWSKIATADLVITYSQSEAEKERGLARLYVLARNDESKFQIIISQSYALGQFHFDSARMSSRYADALKDAALGSVPDADDEEPVDGVKAKKPRRKLL